MDLQRFQAVVLRLGNQMFVRHYLWLNYPNDPQLMGIELIGQAPNGNARKSSCECGVCAKCKHREYMRGYRPKGRLAQELTEMGFTFNEGLGIWTIERQDGRLRSGARALQLFRPRRDGGCSVRRCESPGHTVR